MNVYILLDRSQSMENLWTEALGSINGYVKDLLSGTKVFLAAFDTLSYDVLRNTTSQEWKNVTSEDAQPRGGTPLLDATGRLVYRVLDDNADRAIVVIMTDGEENSSQLFKKADVTKLLDKVKSKGYEVLFLGANFDKVGDVAKSLGVLDNTKFRNIQPGEFKEYTRGLAAASTAYGVCGQSINAADINIPTAKA